MLIPPDYDAAHFDPPTDNPGLGCCSAAALFVALAIIGVGCWFAWCFIG